MAKISLPILYVTGKTLEPLEITAEPDERFVAAVRRAQGSEHADVPDYAVYALAIDDEKIAKATSYRDYVEIPPQASVADVARLSGQVPFVVSHGGWGGDALWHEPLLSIWEVLQFGLTLQGAYAIAKGAHVTLDRLRYREHRRLAADWRDYPETPVAMELLQLIKTRHEWWRRHFDYQFGLDGSAGAALLRRVGYRKVRSQPDALWRESEDGGGDRYDLDHLPY